MMEHAATQLSHWWIKKGYYPFELGKSGFPRPGQVVKHYRRLKINDKNKPWTQRDLARVLGVSEQTIRDLENRDAGMDSCDRRRFLADLFNIPYVLLGIVSLDEILKQQAEQKQAEATYMGVSTQQSVFVDAQEYQDKLLSYWSTNHTDTAQGIVGDILENLDTLYRALAHVRGQEKSRITELACGYHQFIANVLRDRLHFAAAINHLDLASGLASSLENRELQALILHRRAITYQEKGNINAALHDCKEACQLEQYISSPLRGAIFLEAGHIEAKAARSEKERNSALARIEQAGQIIRSAPFSDDPHFLKLTTDRYHLTRGAALIAVGWNTEAISELALVHTQPEQKRRRAYNDILLAQAYTNKGNYPMAASLAEAGLIVVKDIQSGVNIERVSSIYKQLSESSFRNNADVGRLKYLLLSK